MTGCGGDLAAGRWPPPRCGPSGDKAAGGKGSVDNVPTRLGPKCAYGMRCMSLECAVRNQMRGLNVVFGGQDAARSEICVCKEGGSTNAAGREDVGVSADSEGMVPGGMLGCRLVGLWQDTPGSRGVGVAPKRIDRR
jgi:hypothetical protein